MVTTTLDNLQYFHLRLGPGEDLFQSLRVFLDEQGLARAFLLSTIGSLHRVVVNFPKALVDNPEVGSIVLDGPFEINGISGEVWREDKGIRVHLHGTVTREGSGLYGGGLGDGAVVLKLAEMVIAGVKQDEMRLRKAMPMYTFHCPTCGNEFELFLRPSEAFRGAQCPACGEHTLEQAADGPAASPGPACDLSKKT